ncbi:hypothetical protein [uncultured Nostoc sp.]|uniref:hypothetical protein n=1 Tax=uncultured Nostoc sp. TaxID=340711 RepID=UPI0035C96173
MADVRIDDLQPSENELLADDESYMDELSEDELGLVAGGSSPICAASVAAAASSGPCAAGAGVASGVVGAVAGVVWGFTDD